MVKEDYDLQKYVQMLRKSGLKVTPQRIEILRYLDTYRNHPTAEKIYQDVRRKMPSLSKTTVYNTIEALRNNNFVRVLTAFDELRYDINTAPHAHFVCRMCGKVYDIDIPTSHLDAITKIPHKVEEVQCYITGVCKECMAKEGGVKK